MADGEYGVTETDKTAIITACAGGIGLVTATALRREGWRVIMSDADEDAGLREADRIGAEFRRCDVKDGDQIAALFHGIGRLDLLVNNAGIMGPSCPTWECPVESWRETLEVNLTAQMITCKHAVPIMLSQRSGSIVNMSSVAGRRGWPTRAAYAASKWGVLGFTATLAEEVAPHGVRVNAILPGAVDGTGFKRGSRPTPTRTMWITLRRRSIISTGSLSDGWCHPGISPKRSCFWRAIAPRRSPVNSSRSVEATDSHGPNVPVISHLRRPHAAKACAVFRRAVSAASSDAPPRRKPNRQPCHRQPPCRSMQRV